MATGINNVKETLIGPAATAPIVTDEQLDLVRRTVAKDATPDELRLYLFDCQRQGVHPLDKLIHFTKRSGKYTPITSIDFMRIRAAETDEYAGSDVPLFAGDDGIWSSIGAGLKPPVAALVTVWRFVQGQRCKFEAVARWSEYKPDQDFMWKKMPYTMLGKCAEALALRKGFPKQLAGLYAKEEMDQSTNGAAPIVLIETAPATSVAPEGYDAWWAVIQDVCDEGFEPFKKAWKASKPEYRDHLRKLDGKANEKLKARALKATVAAHDEEDRAS